MLNLQSSPGKEFSSRELLEQGNIPAYQLFIHIEKVLNTFSHLFMNEDQLFYFEALILGFILATDKVGVVSSAMRGLKLVSQSFYHRLTRFLRSPKYCLHKLREHWIKTAAHLFEPYTTKEGEVVLIGDHTNVAKDGKKIAGIMKIVSSSVSAAKKEITDCMILGCVCLLTKARKAVPLLWRRHGGLDDILPILKEKNEKLFERIMGDLPDESGLSLVEKMIKDIILVSVKAGFSKVMVVLDRLFASEKLFKTILEWNKKALDPIHALVRFKKSTIGFMALPEKPQPVDPESETKRGCAFVINWLIERINKKRGRGRPRKKGIKIDLSELFTKKEYFKPARVFIYDEWKNIKYLSFILFWGKDLIPVRFTLVIVLDEEDEAKRTMILGTTRLTMNPIEMIELYSYRFRIEQFFRDAKQETAAAKGRFHSHSTPRYSRFKERMLAEYNKITDASSLKKILESIKAMEMFIFMSSVSLSLVYYLCDKFKDRIQDLCPDFSRKKDNQRKVTFTVIQQSLRSIFVGYLYEGPSNSLMRKNLLEQREKGLKKVIRRVREPKKKEIYIQESLF